MLRRLIRMKALDAGRLQGRFVVALDAIGHLAFQQRHCPHCLVYRHATHTVYLHQVLEAKLLGPAGLTLSVASEFIENSDSNSALSGDAQTTVKGDEGDGKKGTGVISVNDSRPLFRASGIRVIWDSWRIHWDIRHNINWGEWTNASSGKT